MAIAPICHPSVWVVWSPSDASMRLQIAVTVARPRLKSQLQKGVWQFLWPVGYHQRFVPNYFLAQKSVFVWGPLLQSLTPPFFYRLTCQTKDWEPFCPRWWRVKKSPELYISKGSQLLVHPTKKNKTMSGHLMGGASLPGTTCWNDK